MRSITINNIKIECIKGDIAAQEEIDAVVNAANAWLKPGGGVAGAIHRAAGPELEKECRKFAPIKPGAAVITRAYQLPNRYVIHCLGPVYGVDRPEAELLSQCYQNALRLAEEHKIKSIAFPALATGYFGYPIAAATEVALRTIIQAIPQLKWIKLIRFVLYSENDLKVYEQTLSRLGAEIK
uniref:Macro domain-containing protein n=1 Tax=candidate division WOR-3 bacterium TaxID=2052148 RepID=A0A7V3UZW3_UNCW3